MSTTTSGRVELDGVREALEQLGLSYASEVLSAHLTEASRTEQAYHVFLHQLLHYELERRLKLSLNQSGLPSGSTLAKFDFGFQPSLDRRQLETLATCQWIRQSATVLLQGPPGVGKTHPGHRPWHQSGAGGVQRGVLPSGGPAARDEAGRRGDASEAASQEVPQGGVADRRRGGFRADEPSGSQEASLFFRLVSYRYQRGSLLITTNKSIRDWPDIFAGDATMATAMLDRLLHKSHVVNVRWRSYRLRELEELLNAPEGKS